MVNEPDIIIVVSYDTQIEDGCLTPGGLSEDEFTQHAKVGDDQPAEKKSFMGEYFKGNNQARDALLMFAIQGLARTPYGLIAVAAGASIAAVVKAVNENKGSKNNGKLLSDMLSEEDINNILSKSMALEYLNKQLYTAVKAKEVFQFQPGHPVVGKAYRRHPLNHMNFSDKSLYIPAENYEKLLMEERENELIKLLIDLGASKIEITKISKKKVKKNLQGKVSASVKTNFDQNSAEINLDSARNLTKRHKNYKFYTFDPAARVYKNDLDVNQYSWLKFEPTWLTTVHSRIVGKCTSARIELTENLALESSVGLDMKAIANIFSVDVLGQKDGSSTKKDRYIIDVEFSPIIE